MNSGPINVLQFIAPTGFYGAERWIVALERNLDRRRVRSTVAVTSEDRTARVELLEHLPSHTAMERIEMGSRFDWRVVRKLMDVIRVHDIDVLHSHGYKSDVIGVIAARRCGIPCITTPHGFNDRVGLKLRLYVAAGALSYRFFDRVVPLSEDLCRQVRELGVSPNVITYIANGIDLTEVGAPIAERRCEPITHFGYVGQMIPRKRVDHIIRTFDRLWRHDPRLRLSLIGDGSELRALERLASQLPSRDSVAFLGFRDDRLELMRTIDVFVMASAQEGVPRAMMEAMAIGVPAVAYDIPGIDLLVHHGKTGLLAKAGDLEDLYRQCQSLVSRPNLAVALGRCASRLVREDFSAARMAREYELLYESLAGRACAA